MKPDSKQILLYKQILGVHKDTSREELKRQYRIRAKHLHPDHNPNTSSHEQFVLLNQAYSYLDKVLAEPEIINPLPPFDAKKYPNSYNAETWKYEQRKVAREKMAQRKRMKDEQYEKLGYNKIVDRIIYLAHLFQFALAIFILIPFPILMFVHEGFLGLIIALLVQGATYPLWTSAIKRFIPIN